MLLGPTGCSKTAIWRTLAGAHNLDKEEKRHTCIYETVRNIVTDRGGRGGQ